MRWISLLAAGLLALAGCANHQATLGEPIEQGWIDRAVLSEPDHRAFADNYDAAVVDTGLVHLISGLVPGIRVVVALGTWCSDSRQEVPHFLKVADRAGIPADSVALLAVNRSMDTPEGTGKRYGIERVPTFIFYREGVEIGRIVEFPRMTIEGDMMGILAGGGSGGNE